MKNGLLILFVMLGMSVSLGEAVLYGGLVSWWVLLVAVALFLVGFVFVACMELRSGLIDTLGWALILALSVLSGYIGIRLFGISSGGLVHLGICVLYALLGLGGLSMRLRTRLTPGSA